jgi:branched-chain amino acid transport system substrate-binding protein
MIGLSSTDAQIAMGEAAFGIIQIFTWHADWPYVDSISGLTCRELADKYEADLEKPWDQFITGYMRSAWAVDVLQRTKDLDDKESVLEAIATTKLDTILGPVDFTETAPAGQLVTPTVFKTAVALGQHRPGTKWFIETPMVAVIDAPGVTEADLTPPFVLEWD